MGSRSRPAVARVDVPSSPTDMPHLRRATRALACLTLTACAAAVSAVGPPVYRHAVSGRVLRADGAPAPGAAVLVLAFASDSPCRLGPRAPEDSLLAGAAVAADSAGAYVAELLAARGARRGCLSVTARDAAGGDSATVVQPAVRLDRRWNVLGAGGAPRDTLHVDVQLPR